MCARQKILSAILNQYTEYTRKYRYCVKLRYRQADEAIAETILASVPEDIDLKKIYGLGKITSLPVVEMVEKKVTLRCRQEAEEREMR